MRAARDCETMTIRLSVKTGEESMCLYYKRERIMQTQEIQIWDIWVPDIGAQGLSFARGRLNATDVLFVHAAPEKLNVEVRSDDGSLLAKGANLPRTVNSPMTRLRRSGDTITRED